MLKIDSITSHLLVIRPESKASAEITSYKPTWANPNIFCCPLLVRYS